MEFGVRGSYPNRQLHTSTQKGCPLQLLCTCAGGEKLGATRSIRESDTSRKLPIFGMQSREVRKTGMLISMSSHWHHLVVNTASQTLSKRTRCGKRECGRVKDEETNKVDRQIRRHYLTSLRITRTVSRILQGVSLYQRRPENVTISMPWAEGAEGRRSLQYSGEHGQSRSTTYIEANTRRSTHAFNNNFSYWTAARGCDDMGFMATCYETRQI
ncbi:uncharacterized protein C8Q71DRAFT_480331 [Rhodofomes roseus]|uniref:Uncharacterized protein n=1 Tax=Rhodofomes roseus TaxID=34475 RepID=A0ABQ8KPQ8_9APHY|nr:uncharacterized protein C8Q71DRAFT_480331 [Rhodofomes roseus]KAH9840173.1 hypothetical protein C8Q71DRAFT_480331 [Rhodofomes roseus]